MLWASQFRKDIEVLELFQGRATSLDYQSHEERLRELGFSLAKKKRLRADISLYNSLKGGYNQLRVGCLSQASSDSITGYSVKLYQGRLRLEIRKNFFTERVLRHGDGLPQKVMESPSLVKKDSVPRSS